jgi:hypothetical protein
MTTISWSAGTSARSIARLSSSSQRQPKKPAAADRAGRCDHSHTAVSESANERTTDILF